MKTRIRTPIAVALLLSILNPPLSTAFAQGTAFTYQGHLTDGGKSANGLYDIVAIIYPDETGPLSFNPWLTNEAVTVVSGLFTIALDFGADVFTGPERWLALSVRTNSGGAFTALSPRQKLTATPYAITAGNVTGVIGADGLAGTYSGAVTFDNAANSFVGAFTGDGAELTGLNASELSSGTVPSAALGNAWRTTGNAGTDAAPHFVGTTDEQPLILRVNNQRTLRLEPDPTGQNAPNVIGGSVANFVASGVVGAVIGGGGATAIPGFPFPFNRPNSVGADFGTVSGGLLNAIQTDASAATIAGGFVNAIQLNSPYASIGGGTFNVIQSGASAATIGGGTNNTIRSGAMASAIGGGERNTIQTNATHAAIGGGYRNELEMDAYGATIGGGALNTIRTDGLGATIGGGEQNTILAGGVYATIPGDNRNHAARFAFAAGFRAKANHEGAFVWGDSSFADIASTNNNSVTFRAAGGYRLFSSSGANAGMFLAPNGNSWSAISDRNVKKHLAPVDGKGVLEKLATLPMHQWRYQWEADDAVPHLGPMAQDFKAAFYPGRDDKSITTQEVDGVTLAAIQGLNLKVNELNDELKRRDAETAQLKQTVNELKALVNALAQQPKTQNR